MVVRTGYSFKKVYGHLKDVLSRLQECGYPAAPIADHCSTFGFVRWNKLCEKAGIKPVFGVELPVTTNLGDKRPILDNWTFIAKDSLRPLHDLIGVATSNAGRDPSLNYRQALSAEGVFKIAGHTARLDEMSPREDLYIGLSPAINKGFFTKAAKEGYSFLARSDNYYPREEDKEAYRVALGRRSNTQTYPLWILSPDEWNDALHWVNEDERLAAIDNANAVMAGSNAKLVKAEMLKPQEAYSLHDLCVKGANALGVNLDDPIYSARLERELALIESKGFSDYIFIIADLVSWAKKRMVVGPARGSSCGSLVCYLTGITSIDPIPYGLLFERFIDINRNDLPDIDIDFSDERRDLVFQYAEEKYGNDHVGRLGTVGIFRPKSALNQVGESLAIPKWMVEKTADGIINRSGGDSRALQALEDTLLSTDMGRKLLDEFPEARIAIQFEGHPQNASQHAAGIIITEKPLTEYVAVNTRSNAVMCDKKDAEDLNLLKIDALGLTQLSIFERTLELIGEKPKSGFLEKLPLDDQAAFDVLNKGHFAGVFQFMGGALKSLTKQINVRQLEDIVSITALARPGPMATGGANSWVKRKNGQEAIVSLHPMLTELTKDTFGIVIYQETVMAMVRELGRMSWEDTSAIRKAMSGRLGNEFFEKFWLKFKDGALQNGIEEETAKAIWDQINTMGSWAFNRCISGGTKIKLAATGSNLPKGGITVAELYRRYEQAPSQWIKQRRMKPWLVSLHPDGRGWPQKALKIIKNGKKVCWRYKFDDGSKVDCTPDHKFFVDGKWLPIGKAKLGSEFAALEAAPQPFTGTGEGKGHSKGKRWSIREGDRKGANNVAWKNGATKYKQEFKLKNNGCPCQDCKQVKSRMEAHHNDFDEGRQRPKDLVWLCASCHKKRHYEVNRKKRWQKGMQRTTKVLLSKTKIGPRQTYDIEMPKHHNFTLANGLVTHNSHAVAYGIVSYWCCWLKAHHPLEFAAATLDAEKDPEKQLQILRELRDEGIDYLPVDPEHSTDRWAIAEREGRKLLVGPLTQIHGIGPAKVSVILKARAAGEELSPKIVEQIKKGKTKIDHLYPVQHAVKELHPDLNEIGIVTKPTPINEVQCGIEGNVVIIGIARKIAPKDENEEVNVKRRGGKRYSGPTAALNLFVADDRDEIFVKVNRFLFEKYGREIVERGRAGNAIYAIKGYCPKDFRMISAQQIKYLGDLADVK